jgi:hypothetical protein
MHTSQSRSKSSTAYIQKYNMSWGATMAAPSIEMYCIQMGGKWQKKNGEWAGEGLFFHYKQLQKYIFPNKVWHKWNELQLEKWLEHRTMAILGPASSGKTNSAATDHLADYYCFPSITTVIICSTTKERLEDRVWGEIKKYHRIAKELYGWLPGNLIEGRQRLVTDHRTESIEGRDFRNGIIGVPCKKGNDYVGIGDFAGIKNKRVRLLGDELSLLPRSFVDAISNLDKNPDFKCTGLGNPKDTTDALGVLAEPSAELGGWDGGVDQTPGTKFWPTRRLRGITLQFPGSDSPNLDGTLGIPIITQEDIDRDVSFYGKDSLWFTMMDEGRMPRGQGTRRVLTRQMCHQFGALKPAIWSNTVRKKIAFLDAAYGGVGGDRCIFGELQFGQEAQELDGGDLLANLTTQTLPTNNRQQVIALTDYTIVPIRSGPNEQAVDQIVSFVMEQCKARGIPPEDFFFDSGMRTALVTAFSRLWSPSVNSVDCGGNASDAPVSSEIQTLCKDYYSKFITELWFTVRMAVECGQVRALTEDAISEFSQREWTVVGKNKIEVEPKWKMKEKIGRSPDVADAIAVGFYGARQRGFRIAKLRGVDRGRKGEQWKLDLMKRQADVRKSGQLNYSA